MPPALRELPAEPLAPARSAPVEARPAYQKFAVRVAASRIDGQGAFADEPIPPRLKSDPMRYTNHSCRPNARLVIRNGRVEFYALRAIAAGEEVTVDYGETHHEGRLACRCGAPGCRGAL
jgi:hypothetical protein